MTNKEIIKNKKYFGKLTYLIKLKFYQNHFVKNHKYQPHLHFRNVMKMISKI